MTTVIALGIGVAAAAFFVSTQSDYWNSNMLMAFCRGELA